MVIPLTEIIAEIEGKQVYKTDPLPPGEYTVGRGADAHISLDSDHVSRFHGLITLSHSEWSIEDYGGTNGTRVGGVRITERTTIYPNQEVLIGNVKLIFRRVETDRLDGSLPPESEIAEIYLPKEVRDARKYKIGGVIGVGGMGIVMETEDIATRRVVAMKMLKSGPSVEQVTRFISEAQVAAQLEHPNIVPIYELNLNEQGNPFYVMKRVRGVSLQSVIQQLRMEQKVTQARYRLPALLTILGKVCDAIAYAHSKGVVHRDLKPENIMLGEFGEVLVMDWGLAKPLGQNANPFFLQSSEHTMVETSRQKDIGAALTMEGDILGTLQFMSPEQASGESYQVDSRADVYSLGAILYSIITLLPPVDGSSAMDVIEKIKSGDLVKPSEAVKGRKLDHLPDHEIPAELSRITMKAMALKPEDRYSSVKDFQAEIENYQSGEKPGGLFGFFRKGKK